MSEVRKRANGSANGTAATKSTAEDHPYENIFLFIPNLIGPSLLPLP
jgi:CDP-diacylglycerol--inositol 3-phosphatidyltransferase